MTASPLEQLKDVARELSRGSAAYQGLMQRLQIPSNQDLRIKYAPQLRQATEALVEASTALRQSKEASALPFAHLGNLLTAVKRVGEMHAVLEQIKMEIHTRDMLVRLKTREAR